MEGTVQGALRPAASQQDAGKGSMCPPCSLVGGSLPIQIPIFKGEDCLNHVPIRIMNLHCDQAPTDVQMRPLLPRVVNFHGSMVEQQIFSCSGIGEL